MSVGALELKVRRFSGTCTLPISSPRAASLQAVRVHQYGETPNMFRAHFSVRRSAEGSFLPQRVIEVTSKMFVSELLLLLTLGGDRTAVP